MILPDKLAIIIPTYDNLEMLKTLIGQIFSYTPEEFHLFIIEDGQKEETKIYLNELDPKIVTNIFHQENKGVAISWNDGIREAERRGFECFAIFNDDIELYPDWLRDINGKIENGADFIFAGDEPELRIDWTGNPGFAGHFFVLTKHCLDTVGYFDEQFSPYCGEDTDYAFRLKQKEIKTASIPTCLILHHGGTTTNKIKVKDEKAFWEQRYIIHSKLAKKYPLYRFNKNWYEQKGIVDANI